MDRTKKHKVYRDIDTLPLLEMVYQASSTFMHMRKCDAAEQTLDGKQLLKSSREYRSAIRRFVTNNVSKAITHGDGPVASAIEMELIWNFCEILFFSCGADDPLLPHFMKLTEVHFPLSKKAMSTNTPEYWNIVNRYVALGRLTEAQSILEMHPDAKTDEFKSMSELMSGMPPLDTPLNKYKERWNSWRKSVKSHVRLCTFSLDDSLQGICFLMAGMTSAIAEAKSVLHLTWCEALVMRLLYIDPFARFCDMKSHKDAIHAPEVIKAAMDGDVEKMVKAAYNINAWFGAHLADLLLRRMRGGYDGGVYLEEMSRALVYKYPELWQLGMAYLDYSPVRSLQEELIEGLHLQGEYMMRKAILEARKRGLHETASLIYAKQVGLALSQGNAGHALNWALRSSDSYLIGQAVTHILDHFFKTGNMLALDMLEHPTTCILKKYQDLAFLDRFYKFHQLHTQGNLHEAFQIFLDVVQSDPPSGSGLMSDATKVLNDAPEMEEGQLTKLTDFVDRATFFGSVGKNKEGFSSFKKKKTALRDALAHAKTRLKECQSKEQP